MKRFDLIFNPVLTEKPSIALTMFRYNHVYIGCYKGVNKNTQEYETKFFWAEHDNKDSFYKCLISNNNANRWTIDALDDVIPQPTKISTLHQKIITQIKDNQYLLNNAGYVKDTYKILLSKSPTLILRSENDDQEDISIAEMEILDVLNSHWQLDSRFRFGKIK